MNHIGGQRADLNRRPAVYETAALPPELRWLKKDIWVRKVRESHHKYGFIIYELIKTVYLFNHKGYTLRVSLSV
tara:strand:+ start:122 stop:343 length:222 start_codon:yes stop_codon:yes gene_type:complete